MKAAHIIILWSALAINLSQASGHLDKFSDHTNKGHIKRYTRGTSTALTSQFVRFVNEKMEEHSSMLELILKSDKKIEGLLKKLDELKMGVLKSMLLDTDERHLNENNDKDTSTKRIEPTQARPNRLRRQIRVSENFEEFVEEKLTQHSTALEFMFRSAHRIEGLVKKLLVKLEFDSADLLLFGNKEPVIRNLRRYNERSNPSTEKVNPIVSAFQPLFKFGNVARRLIEINFHDEDDPMPIEESNEEQEDFEKHHYQSYKYTGPVRRSYVNPPDIQHGNDKSHLPMSPWCRPAASCKGNQVRVCGRDEKYGLSQFEDVCQMIKYNCLNNINFIVTVCGTPATIDVGS